MTQSIPEVVRPLIGQYVEQLHKQFQDLDYGLYIVGSIALGEFNEYFSDIDFVSSLSRSLTPVEIQQLGEIHQKLEKSHPHWKLSGGYYQLCDLGRLNDLAGPHPHYHDGILHVDGLFEESSIESSITWWELKHFGIPVVGAEAQSLPFHVDWNLLIVKMRENLNTYWAGWTQQPRRILMLGSDWGIQWAVTGVLRQFYSFRENNITTKVRAAHYALGCLPERWHPIIQEAINIRERRKSLYFSRITRAIDAVRFLRYIIETSNNGNIGG